MKRLARTTALLVLALLATFADRADAQSLALEIEAGYLDLSNARESATAVLGSSGGFTYGGKLRVGLGQRFFVAAGLRTFKKDGERVFVAAPGGEVFPLGHPLSVRLRPVRATLGYRFGGGSVTPYVGVGGGFVSYQEKSTVGGVEDEISETKGSGHVVAGVELGGSTVRFAAEVEYSIVPNVIGLGGVSAIYDESDIGGFAVLGKVVVVFGR